MQSPKEIGIVLSGGGVRGVAHVAILKVLEEYNLAPTQLAGSSSGAIVAALYAAGYPPKDIFDFLKTHAKIFQWRRLNYQKPGVLDAESYAEIYDPWLVGKTFEDLNKTVYICATDLLNAKFQFFSSGDLIRPLLASAAVPGVFTPIEIGDTLYVDGGTMNNFPVEPLIGRCDLLIGSFISPINVIKKEEVTNIVHLMNRATALNFYASSLNKFHLCDFMFCPNKLSEYGIFDSDRMDELYEVCYEYAVEKVQELIVKY